MPIYVACVADAQNLTGAQELQEKIISSAQLPYSTGWIIELGVFHT